LICPSADLFPELGNNLSIVMDLLLVLGVVRNQERFMLLVESFSIKIKLPFILVEILALLGFIHLHGYICSDLVLFDILI
jgi:hypothetical protein